MRKLIVIEYDVQPGRVAPDQDVEDYAGRTLTALVEEHFPVRNVEAYVINADDVGRTNIHDFDFGGAQAP